MPWGSKPDPTGAPDGAAPSAPMPGGCPDPRHHYKTNVNKGSIKMDRWESALNGEYRAGYRLVHAFEQDGNTVMVFEHHGH
jgi:hypothetical protein